MNRWFILPLVPVSFITFVEVIIQSRSSRSLEVSSSVHSGTQQFYLNHTDDIISMAVHNGGKHGNIVASGQIGENPTIHVWNPQTIKTLSVLSGKHKKGQKLRERERECSIEQTFISFSRCLLVEFLGQRQTVTLARCRCTIHHCCLALGRR